MSRDPTPHVHGRKPFHSAARTRLIDEITGELRISLGFAVRDSLYAFDHLPSKDRPDYTINVARRCPCKSRFCHTQLSWLYPEPVGDIGAHAFEQGMGDSMLAFALSDTLLLVPDIGQLVIRNEQDWPQREAVHGAITVRRLACGIVDRCWVEGDDPDPVIQFAADMVMAPLEGLRQHLRAMKLA